MMLNHYAKLCCSCTKQQQLLEAMKLCNGSCALVYHCENVITYNYLFSDKLVFQVSQELKRLQRRKALMSGEGSSSQISTGSGGGPGSPGNSKEQPLFTLKQVSGIYYSVWSVTFRHAVLLVEIAAVAS